VFDLSAETFSPTFPYELNEACPLKVENQWAEYNQIVFFLISERLKPSSFWKPFLDYLPK
jgi:hypothetical protein